MSIKWIPWLLALCVVAGCSKVKENLKPVELQPFTASEKFKKVWVKPVTSGQDARYQRLQPLLRGETVYVAGINGDVIALGLAKGKKQWSVELDGELSGGVGYAPGTLLLGTLQGELVAISDTDGSEKWRTAISSEVVSTPAGNAEVAIAKAIDGRVFAVNLADGAVRWSYDHPVPILTLRAQGSPVVDEQNAYVPFDNGQILAFNSTTGQLRWSARVGQPKGKTEIERLVDVDTTPIVSGPFVYAAGYQSRLVAVNRGTGRLNWAQDVSTFQHILEAGDKILVVDSDSHIKAFDAATGTLAWQTDKLHRRALSPPGVLGSQVIVADFEGYLHALDLATGEFTARRQANIAPVYAQPLTVEDKVLLLDKTGTLHVYAFAPAGKPKTSQPARRSGKYR